MIRYAAFLRGINVGGRKIVKMDELASAFTRLGLSNVRTHLQSGNVTFETARGSRAGLERRIEKAMVGLMGDDVAVFLRTIMELEEILELDPFQGRRADGKAKRYVTFISRELRKVPALPLFSPRRDVEIIRIRGRDLFSESHVIGGRYGFPNNFIESEFGVVATTRNWMTLKKIFE